MNRILVVVFNNKSKAFEASNALLRLAEEGSISVFAHAIVAKDTNGTTTVIKDNDESGPGMLTGAGLGSLVGSFGGPSGMVVGALVGLLGGSVVEAHEEMRGEEFIEDVIKELTPNRTALVAEVDEGSTDPVDSRMEPLGAIVFRRNLSDVKHILHKQKAAERNRRKAERQEKAAAEVSKAGTSA